MLHVTYCDVSVTHHMSLTVSIYVYVCVAADVRVHIGPTLYVTYCDVSHTSLTVCIYVYVCVPVDHSVTYCMSLTVMFLSRIMCHLFYIYVYVCVPIDHSLLYVVYYDVSVT